MFHEIKHPRNALVLCFPGTAEGCSVDVDVKSASAGLMAAIIHVDSGFHYLRPGHFIFVIAERHRVSYDFHPVVQTSVGFYVDVLRNPVADTQKRISVVAVLTALVDFKFHAEITLAVTVKYRVGLVAVFVNGAVLTFLVTPVAIGVIVVIFVICVIPMNDSAAALAGRVVIIVAGVAERRTVVPALSSAQILSPQCEHSTVSL